MHIGLVLRRFGILGVLLAGWAMTCAISAAAAADNVYQKPESFLQELFGHPPAPSVLWLTPEMQTEVTRILGHAPTQLRQRYWNDGSRSAWILEEIGKEDFITAAFVVKSGHIEQVRVLVYRETRGAEVRYSAFLRQFQGAALSADDQLDKEIDGISGATLSVHAMERMARTALYFDRMAQRK